MKDRLARLEKATREHAGPRCPLCRGAPFVTIYEFWEGSPDRGDWRLTERWIENADKFTGDFRCRRCGARARETRIFGIPDRTHLPPNAGRDETVTAREVGRSIAPATSPASPPAPPGTASDHRPPPRG